MFESLSFILIFLAILLVPGWTILNFSTGKKLAIDSSFSYLFSFTISYGVFALSVVFARAAGFSLSQFSLLVSGYIALSLAALAYRLIINSKRTSNRFIYPSAQNWPIVIIWVILTIYHFSVGAYTEIPADIYYHIEKFRQNYQVFVDGSMDPLGSVKDVITQDAEVWYHLLAWITVVTQSSTDQMIQISTWLSQGLFLTACFYLSKIIFHTSEDKIVISLFATGLVALHFGVSAFSFVRYYALAPAMLAFVVYFFSVIVCWNILSRRTFEGLFSKVVLIFVALIAAVLIHTQEAMFIVIHLSIMILIYSFLKLGQGPTRITQNTDTQRSHQAEQVNHPHFLRFIFSVATFITIVFFAAYLYAHLNLVHFGNNGNRLLEFGPSFGILPRLSILNPTYQFTQVVTLWGLVVYALFFFHWRRYQHKLIVVSGMLLPFLTVFNPLFTDLFLRLTDSTVLWRFCFLVPIYYVAADLIVYYVRGLFAFSYTHNDSHIDNHSQESRNSIITKAVRLAVLAMLAILLLPFNNGWKNLHYSRYPTLKSVDQSQSYQHLSDVIVFLNQFPKRNELLTDPVTGYILSGFTPHINYRDKFFVTPYSGFKKFTFDSYDDLPLGQYAGDFLLINQRTINNGNSFVGAVSRHWPTDLFQRISPFYPNQLIEHVQSYPEKFELLFDQDDFLIYRVL